VTTPGASESYADSTATVKLTSYRRGDKVDLSCMHAVPIGRSETDQDYDDVSKTQTVKIDFNNSGGEYPPKFYLFLVQSY